MRTLLLWALVGLIGAGLVHGVSLLALPLVAEQTAYDRLAEAGLDHRFNVLADPDPERGLLPLADPSFVVASCRYDLDAGPVRVEVPLPESYGSVAFYNRFGQVFYSLTDRAATAGKARVLVLGEEDTAVSEPTSTPGTPEALRIASPTRVGFILLRLRVPSPGARTAMRALAETAQCNTIPRG